MNENIQIMLKKLSEDEEAQKKLAAIRDPEEAYQLVTSIHGGYTKEEFVAAMTAIHEQLNQDLSDDDLAKTAGGVDKEDAGVSAAISAAGSAVGTAISSAITASYITSLIGSAAISGGATVVVGGAASAAV